MRALIVAVVCASFGVASAGVRERAHELFLEGRELLTSQQTEAACEKFEESIALDPTAPGVMLNLGLCYELLEKFATSLYWFRKAQVAAAEAKLPDYEDEAKRHTLALSTKVSIVRLDVSAAPGAEVRIDGRLISPVDYARVEVDRGPHTIEVRAAGKQTHSEEFEVSSTQAKTIVIPALADDERSKQTITTEPTESIVTGRNVLAATFGVVGVGLCIASPLWARKIKRDYEAELAMGRTPSYSSARAQQHVATGMFVAGLGLVGFGTYLYLTRPQGVSSTTAIVPMVGSDQLGLAISGAL